MENKEISKTTPSKKSQLSFHRRCAKLRKQYGIGPIEVLWKLLKHKDDKIKIRAAATLLEKLVATPKHYDLDSLNAGLQTGLITINIGGDKGMVQVGKSQTEPPAEQAKINVVQRKIVSIPSSTLLTSATKEKSQSP